MADEAAPRVAVVTGASAGIGRAISVALGGLGWPVALGARRVDQLEETATLVREAGGTAFAHALDVCDPASIDAFLAAATAALGPINVLVNNAGTAVPGQLHEMDDAMHQRIIATNLLGPILLTKRIVADLRVRKAPGEIVFISSIDAVNQRPYLGTYGASKAGLEAYASALAMECEDFPIRSSIVRAGDTRGTGFAEGWDIEQFTVILPHWQRFGIQRHFNTMQPADIARAVVTSVTAPAPTWIPIVEVRSQPPS